MKTSRFFLLACTALLVSAPASAEDDRVGGATYNELRMTTQEGELRALGGRVEQIEFTMRRIEQNLQKLQSDVEMRLNKLESGTAVSPSASQQAPQSYPSSSASQSSSFVDATGSLGALKMQGGKVTGGVNKPQSPPLPTVPADYGLTPQEQYERAFNFLRDSDYAEAEEAFKTFIEKNPKEKLLDNAKYWYAETLYVRARYDEAAVAFADAYQQNSKGVKAADSLLKLGMSLAALNKIPDACVTFTELKNKYPNASPTTRSRADDERAKLKCPAR
jgi:tol-pal system protein YbgF